MSRTRQVSWGDGLVVEAYHTDGGLKAAVAAITAEVGLMMGNRNTFARLLRVQSPEELSPRARVRAWALVAALHCEPREWGLSDDDAPGPGDPEALKARLRARVVRREGLEPPTRCVEEVELAEVIPFPLREDRIRCPHHLPRHIPRTRIPTIALKDAA